MSEWVIRVFVLMPFDVVESNSDWVAFVCSLTDSHIHIAVISSGIIWPGSWVVTQFGDIGDYPKAVTEAL